MLKEHTAWFIYLKEQSQQSLVFILALNVHPFSNAKRRFGHHTVILFKRFVS